MAVRTVEGIFRKLGDKEGRKFIKGYVSEQAARMRPQSELINFLECSRSRMGRDWTLADEAIKIFNQMEATGGAVGGEPDMGQAARY